MEYTMRPIGIIRSPFQDKRSTPFQPSRSGETGQVEVFPEFVEGLLDLEAFSHIFLLYVFHRSSGYQLRIKPFLDNQIHGLFATRYPYRPNPIGLSIVKLIGRNENILEIDGVDVLDGSPLLDIKPYVPEFDMRVDASLGWFETRSNQT